MFADPTPGGLCPQCKTEPARTDAEGRAEAEVCPLAKWNNDRGHPCDWQNAPHPHDYGCVCCATCRETCQVAAEPPETVV